MKHIIKYSDVVNEFFHLYQRRYKSNLNKSQKKTLHQARNNEALAMVLDRCGSFAIGAAGFEVNNYEKAIQRYNEKQSSQSIYDRTFEKNLLSDAGIDHRETSIGYTLGVYALWDQFGTDIQPFEKSKISDMLKFCRYVVKTIPDVKALREIELSDYLPMPRPDFYWDKK